jgi:hypothetical protein
MDGAVIIVAGQVLRSWAFDLHGLTDQGQVYRWLKRQFARV